MDNSIVMKEIIDFCKDNNLDSYYELSTYAYKHECEEWIKLLKRKNTRMVIASYLESKHRKNGTKYEKSKSEAMEENVSAKSEYYQKREKAYIKELDAWEDSVLNEDKNHE